MVEDGQRIAKFIASAGVCSRRDAEKLILAGEVAVDGEIISSPALNVNSSQKIMVRGSLISAEPVQPRLWILHKPLGYLTTNKDPEGRATVFDILPHNMPRVISIGRLDINSEGLLLFTNSGALARQMELPSSNLERCYRVRVFGELPVEKLKDLQNGITIRDDKTAQLVQYSPIKVEIEGSSKGKNHWIKMHLHEGKNREIRKVCAHLGLQVNRLIRVSYGSFTLGDIKAGDCFEVPKKKAQAVAEELGVKA